MDVQQYGEGNVLLPPSHALFVTFSYMIHQVRSPAASPKQVFDIFVTSVVGSNIYDRDSHHAGRLRNSRT